MITVNVDAAGGEPPPLSTEVVAALIRTTLTESDIPVARIQVVFTDDEHLHRLKQQFFGLNHYTDVIAFQLQEPGEPLEGEIYISCERAQENSRKYSEPYHRELMRLIVHGSLHLAGYSDDTPENQAGMQALEDRFLAAAPSTGS